jgi:beta-lactamase superfamily II metal-dependent hydrolase
MNCEIEFLPVGDGSKPGDAIVVRYGDVNSYELMIVDGGNLDSGKALVEHIHDYFGSNSMISHVVLTHPDADHASGLREVLSGLTVKNLWLHMPWLFAKNSRPYFLNKNWTDEGLTKELINEYPLIVDLVNIAEEQKTQIIQPFAGGTIGPFRILSPYQEAYPFLLPQFDKTPEADQAAIEAAGWWIGKEPNLLAKLFEKAAAKVQKWIKESWDKELLKDGGITSACNETSVVLYGDFGVGRRVLLTGDVGAWGFAMAAHCAAQNNLALQDFMFVQIPHHGSRRNVGPTTLNQFLGPIQAEGTASRFSAFVSAPKDNDTHPRKMVLNAFIRRGARVLATQGNKKVYWGGFPPRPGYTGADPLSFTTQVEEYD